MDEVYDFLSRVKAPEEPQTSTSTYHQPSVSSPIYTPSPGGPQPHHPSAIISPNTSTLNTPANEAGPAGLYRGAPDLLGLFKSRQPYPASSSAAAAQQPFASPPESSASQNRPISAADLVAGFSRKTSSIGSVQSPTLAGTSAGRADIRGGSETASTASAATANPQDFLLKLLNQAKADPAVVKQTERLATAPADPAIVSVFQTQAAANAGFQAQSLIETDSLPSAAASTTKSPPARVFGQQDLEHHSSFDASQAKANPFTYINPFEQLSASSPLHRSPKPDSRTGTPRSEGHKRTRDASKEISSHAGLKSQQIASSDMDDTGPMEAPPAAGHETVSEAVEEVGELVEKQVEDALAQLTVKENGNTTSLYSKHLDVPTGSSKTTRAPVSEDMASASEDQAIAGSWEDVAAGEPLQIHVYNLPMKPFVSIDIKKLDDPAVGVPQDKILTIARMRKEFDQIDRNLVVASSKFIAYTLKSGGIRLIRQDSGKYKTLFGEERVFNVTMSLGKKADSTHETQTILGTGVNGTAFWAPLANFANDREISNTTLDEERGFVFPPVPATDENTSGGQLKTRIKASTRNPDFFAYGRGKFIHIIWPIIARSATYTDPKTKLCNSEKYLNDDSLKISTGKAAKDFSFSADDTVIVSLDKAGKLKFWDIRPLTKNDFNSEYRAGTVVEVDTPLMVLSTAVSSEKTWPTSVMFVDKEKPMTRGLALRYLVVGLKQNHTVQLWDLGLNKPVQEINFPHEDESDAICSLAFHPRTGILVVGHPTRNSVYLLHVSPPKYTLPPMGQAKYISLVTAKDKSLPAPNSTVIVSSIREYSLASHGILRSLDLIHEIGSSSSSNQSTDDKEALISMYVMHSKGIMELNLHREHLGWSSEGKTLNSVDAEATKAITIEELRQPQQAPLPEPSSNGDVSAATTAVKKDVAPAAAQPAKPVSENGNVAPKHDNSKAATTNASDKEKKKKQKKEAVTSPGSHVVATAKSMGSNFGKPEAPISPTPSPPRRDAPELTSLRSAGQSNLPSIMNVDDFKRLENMITTEFNRVLSGQFDDLYRKIAEDKRVQDALGSAKQDAVLRLVSKTLTENVESSLRKIVMESLTKVTLEPIKEVISATVDRSITTAFANSMKVSIPRELQKSLPPVMTRVMEDPSIIGAISDVLLVQIGNTLESHLPRALRDAMPGFQAVVLNSTKQFVGEFEHRFAEEFRKMEIQRQKDSATIERLNGQVNGLMEVVRAMAEGQMKFQSEMIAMMQQQQKQNEATRQSIHHTREISSGGGHASNRRSSNVIESLKPKPKSKAELEMEDIQDLLGQGKFDEATIKWLHSDRQGELFDDVFRHVSPAYLQRMPPLVVLSITAAVTFSLDSYVSERLGWLEYALNLLNPKNTEYDNVLPKIMDVLSSRLQQAYMTIAENNPQAQILQRISFLARRTQEMKAAAGSMG